MTHNKPTKEEGLFPLPFLFFVYAGLSTFGLRLQSRRNVAEIAQKQQAEGGQAR